ncbi:MAG TPA: hypothetical protein VN809_07610 [Telmatospirillum sp.]|nr:hypothetical protein [Telmatospirillum sp.]
MSSGKHYSLIAKIGGAMVAVSVLALALASVLNLLRFEEAYQSLVAQRLQVTAQEIARVLEVGLDLGLPVDSQDNLSGTVRHYLITHPDIRMIAIHACDGRPVIREDRSDDTDEPWRDHLGKASWFSVDPDGLSVGLGISDPLGSCAAGIAITQSADAYHAAVATITNRFLTAGLAAALATATATVAAAFLFGRRRPTLQKADEDFTEILAGTIPVAHFQAEDASERWEQEVVAAYLAARPAIIDLTAGRHHDPEPH